MRIAIIGCNYQGLVTATGLAENGHQVSAYDPDGNKLAALRAGDSPVHEPGLEELIASNMEEERLSFTGDLNEAISGTLMVFFCVAPEPDTTGGLAMAPLFDAVRAMAPTFDGYRIVVLRSLCPPGTGESVADTLRKAGARDFDVVVNPDFLRQGRAIEDFMRPSRVIIGCDDVRVREIMKELYSPFLRTGQPFVALSMRTAELSRYATSALLAVRISMMNQLAGLCAAYGADVSELREGLSADERIGGKYLFPGIGYGGTGLVEDVRMLRQLAHEQGVAADLIDAVHSVNERQIDNFIQRVVDFYGDGMAGVRIAVWGASFKPRTDELRGAPAVRLIDRLLDAGAEVTVYDPMAGAALQAQYSGRVQVARKQYDALEGAEGLCIVTEWNAFRRPDYARMGEAMRRRVIFDGRNLYTPRVMQDEGFTYFSVGRPAVVPD